MSLWRLEIKIKKGIFKSNCSSITDNIKLLKPLKRVGASFTSVVAFKVYCHRIFDHVAGVCRSSSIVEVARLCVRVIIQTLTYRLTFFAPVKTLTEILCRKSEVSMSIERYRPVPDVTLQ